MSFVLILGSGPDVMQWADRPKPPFERIVAINNAWRVRPDWDDLIYPEDMDPARLPQDIAPHQRCITARDFVPIQNQFGGFIYAGGTMAMTAGYWALGALRPKVMAFMGCDMIYAPSGPTHFYGRGAADPLRDDITLRSLEAKSARLLALAAQVGCAVVNLSQGPSRLVFPRAGVHDISTIRPRSISSQEIDPIREREERLGYYVPSGRYWEAGLDLNPAELDALDALWLQSIREKVP